MEITITKLIEIAKSEKITVYRHDVMKAIKTGTLKAEKKFGKYFISREEVVNFLKPYVIKNLTARLYFEGLCLFTKKLINEVCACESVLDAEYLSENQEMEYYKRGDKPTI